ncbi:MAG: ABC transporter ATP-binding protein [Burkholderiaceae bacterium]|nr:ABC transporter ATP-binding protein [Burkholderiaceae bacterium]
MTSTASGKALLTVDGVTVRFGGLTAVDKVSFTVQRGELLGLIGPNGAGKTTMLRAITGVVTATQGEVYMDDEPLVRLSIDQRVRRGLSLSQQLVKPLRNMTLLDNVALAAGFHKTRSPIRSLLHVSSAAEREIAMNMLKRVGITDRAEQMPGTQPLGILKRLELARALALQPKLFLLDEPLAGLNSKEAQAFANTILDIHRSGMTIVLIEHNLGEVMRLCQRLVVLDNGKKIGDGEPRSVMNDPQVQAAYLGGDTLSNSQAQGV